jgi:hypothetical protein
MEMKRLLPSAALVLMLAFNACSKSEVKKATDQGGQAGPEWALTLKATCTDGSTDTCLAYYGFSVDAAGKYTIGATHAAHKPRVRALAVDEVSALEPLLAPYLAALRANTAPVEKCVANDTVVPASQEYTVSLTRLGATAVLARETVKDSCTSLVDAEQTQALVAKVLELATAHYPTPYPDACLDAIDQFEAKYADLQSCSVATDCGYVGESFDVIPYDSNQVVFLEDWTKINPIVVGNASKLTAGREALMAAREELKTSCGPSIYRNPAPINFRQFYANAGNPLCEQNTCKVNPAVFQRKK